MKHLKIVECYSRYLKQAKFCEHKFQIPKMSFSQHCHSRSEKVYLRLEYTWHRIFCDYRKNDAVILLLYTGRKTSALWLRKFSPWFCGSHRKRICWKLLLQIKRNIFFGCVHFVFRIFNNSQVKISDVLFTVLTFVLSIKFKTWT